MSELRTYQDYKEFFRKVNEANELEFYQFSFILLFSFLENRVNRIFEVQFLHEKGRPSPYEKEPIGWKLRQLPKLKMTISPSIMKTLDIFTKRRNEIIHEALFNIHTISKEDITFLTKFCRSVDKIRTTQKKRLGQTGVKPLTLRFSKPLPDISSFRKVDNPTSYPLSHGR